MEKITMAELRKKYDGPGDLESRAVLELLSEETLRAALEEDGLELVDEDKRTANQERRKDEKKR